MEEVAVMNEPCGGGDRRRRASLIRRISHSVRRSLSRRRATASRGEATGGKTKSVGEMKMAGITSSAAQTYHSPMIEKAEQLAREMGLDCTNSRTSNKSLNGDHIGEPQGYQARDMQRIKLPMPPPPPPPMQYNIRAPQPPSQDTTRARPASRTPRKYGNIRDLPPPLLMARRSRDKRVKQTVNSMELPTTFLSNTRTHNCAAGERCTPSGAEPNEAQNSITYSRPEMGTPSHPSIRESPILNGSRKCTEAINRQLAKDKQQLKLAHVVKDNGQMPSQVAEKLKRLEANRKLLDAKLRNETRGPSVLIDIDNGQNRLLKVPLENVNGAKSSQEKSGRQIKARTVINSRGSRESEGPESAFRERPKWNSSISLNKPRNPSRDCNSARHTCRRRARKASGGSADWSSGRSRSYSLYRATSSSSHTQPSLSSHNAARLTHKPSRRGRDQSSETSAGTRETSAKKDASKSRGREFDTESIRSVSRVSESVTAENIILGPTVSPELRIPVSSPEESSKSSSDLQWISQVSENLLHNRTERKTHSRVEGAHQQQLSFAYEGEVKFLSEVGRPLVGAPAMTKCGRTISPKKFKVGSDVSPLFRVNVVFHATKWSHDLMLSLGAGGGARSIAVATLVRTPCHWARTAICRFALDQDTHVDTSIRYSFTTADTLTHPFQWTKPTFHKLERLRRFTMEKLRRTTQTPARTCADVIRHHASQPVSMASHDHREEHTGMIDSIAEESNIEKAFYSEVQLNLARSESIDCQINEAETCEQSRGTPSSMSSEMSFFTSKSSMADSEDTLEAESEPGLGGSVCSLDSSAAGEGDELFNVSTFDSQSVPAVRNTFSAASSSEDHSSRRGPIEQEFHHLHELGEHAPDDQPDGGIATNRGHTNEARSLPLLAQLKRETIFEVILNEEALSAAGDSPTDCTTNHGAVLETEVSGRSYDSDRNEHGSADDSTDDGTYRMLYGVGIAAGLSGMALICYRQVSSPR